MLTSSECSAISLRAYSSMASAVDCSRGGSNERQQHEARVRPCLNSSKQQQAGQLRGGAVQAFKIHPALARPWVHGSDPYLVHMLRSMQCHHILHRHVSGVDQQAVAQPVAHLREGGGGGGMRVRGRMGKRLLVGQQAAGVASLPMQLGLGAAQAMMISKTAIPHQHAQHKRTN